MGTQPLDMSLANTSMLGESTCHIPCEAIESLTIISFSLGSIAEYERLQELGVEVEGKIALVKYGGLFRGLKVKNAQDHGMIGVIIFTDPDGDGEYTVANGYEHYPGKYGFSRFAKSPC